MVTSDGPKPPPFWLHFSAGGIAGTIGAAVTCPLEVVKTRLQSSLFSSAPVAYSFAKQPLRYVSDLPLWSSLMHFLILVSPHSHFNNLTLEPHTPTLQASSLPSSPSVAPKESLPSGKAWAPIWWALFPPVLFISVCIPRYFPF